jgi:nucleoside-diphosphate-sugar epimerase
VTGATGTTGSALVELLSERGVPVRVMVRREVDATRVGATPESVVVADFDDSDSLAAAVDGVSQAYLVTPSSEDAEAQQTRFAEIAAKAGLELLVVSVRSRIRQHKSAICRPLLKPSSRARTGDPLLTIQVPEREARARAGLGRYESRANRGELTTTRDPRAVAGGRADVPTTFARDRVAHGVARVSAAARAIALKSRPFSFPGWPYPKEDLAG